MFGKKNRELEILRKELAEVKGENEKLKASVVASTEQVNYLMATNKQLEKQLTAAKARLREIQDLSNARTRKCREKKKAAK